MTTEEMTMTVGAIVTVDDGTYPANLIGLEDFAYGEGHDAKTLRRWKFGLDALDSDGNPAEVDGVSSTALGPKSKAYGWVTALLGRKLEKGEQITRSMLIDRECLVEVFQNEEGYSKIRNVIAAPRKRTAGTSPSAPAAAAEPVYPDSPPRRLDAAGTPLEPVRTGEAIDVDDIPF